MKLYIKKVYCGNCQRLVRTREQKANNSTRVLCARCGHPLQVWEHMAWLGTRDSD